MHDRHAVVVRREDIAKWRSLDRLQDGKRHEHRTRESPVRPNPAVTIDKPKQTERHEDDGQRDEELNRGPESERNGKPGEDRWPWLSRTIERSQNKSASCNESQE